MTGKMRSGRAPPVRIQRVRDRDRAIERLTTGAGQITVF
jgi:hypothetical protein